MVSEDHHWRLHRRQFHHSIATTITHRFRAPAERGVQYNHLIDWRLSVPNDTEMIALYDSCPNYIKIFRNINSAIVNLGRALYVVDASCRDLCY